MIKRILHFSDIHFGQEKNDLWAPHDDVRAELLADLVKVQKDNLVGGRADLILIAGDIAQKGLEIEFKKAAEWLDEVKSVACTDDVIVRTVPGNHDVNLSALTQEGQLVQDAIRSQTQLEQAYAYLEAIGDQKSSWLSAKFADYQSFAFIYGSDLPSFANPKTITHIDMEGGKGLRLIGLCTVLVSDKSDARGRMVLGRHQYGTPRDSRYEDIVLMHHPAEWLKDRMQAEPYLHSRARLLLTGHEHMPHMNRIERDNGFEQIEIAAGAVTPPLGEDGYGYCYNWIELAWSADSPGAVLEVTLYPRRWNPSSTDFIADSTRLAGKKSRTVKLNCGPRPADSARPPASPAAEGVAPDPAPVQQAGHAISAEQAEIILSLPETDPHPATEDVSSYELLRQAFWKYLDKANRVDTLVRLGLLTEHARNHAPAGFERLAFELARERRRLHELWEATMERVPPADRQPNPFPKAS